MLATLESAAPRRRALRRSVRIECAAESALWDDSASFVATDLSPYGLWLDTELALEIGERITVSFRPPQWPAWASPLTVHAEVVRVNLPRRRSDHGAPGMGLRFLDLDRDAGARMTELLRGLPPPLPLRLPETDFIALLESELSERVETELIADGTRFEFSAEAPLLTAPRRERPRASKLGSRIARARQRARTRRGGTRGKRRRLPDSIAIARKPKLRLVS